MQCNPSESCEVLMHSCDGSLTMEVKHSCFGPCMSFLFWRSDWYATVDFVFCVTANTGNPLS